MTISTKGEYALRALLELGLRNGESVSLREIAKRWALPEHYLEQVMASLRKSGLVRSKRGAAGGYSLGRPANQITIQEILQILEGPVEPFFCVPEPGKCQFSPACSIRVLIHQIKDAVESVLGAVTLADLCQQQKEKQSQPSGMFHI